MEVWRAELSGVQWGEEVSERVSAVEERTRLKELHEVAIKDRAFDYGFFLAGAIAALDYIIDGSPPPSSVSQEELEF